MREFYGMRAREQYTCSHQPVVSCCCYYLLPGMLFLLLDLRIIANCQLRSAARSKPREYHTWCQSQQRGHSERKSCYQVRSIIYSLKMLYVPTFHFLVWCFFLPKRADFSGRHAHEPGISSAICCCNGSVG